MERTKIIDKFILRAARQVMAKDNAEVFTLGQLLDLLNTGKANKRGALSEVTYFSCLRILSESMGKLPLKIMLREKDGGIAEAYDHPLYNMLRMRPNPYMTATGFQSTMELLKHHYGNAYGWIRGAGTRTAVWPLETQRVSVWWDDAKILAESPALWYIYNDPKGKRHPIHSDSMLHYRTGMSEDGITGMSVQNILRASVDGATQSQTMLNRLYENGMTAKAVLQYTGELNPDNVKAFTKQIEEYAQGKVEDTENFIPIPLGVSVQPLSIKLTDAQFLELRRYSALQIAAAFGIKPNQINDYEKASYAAAEQQNLAFYTDTLLYPIKMEEEEIKYKLLWEDKNIFPKYNVASILRADQKTQMDTLSNAVKNCIYTPNEARAYLDKKAMPGGDQLYGNGNLIPITIAGEQYKNRGGGNNE